MLELITMSLLSAAYINACIEEAKEEERLGKEERIRDLKIQIFCYAVKNGMLHNEVVEMIQSGKLTFIDIEEGLEV